MPRAVSWLPVMHTPGAIAAEIEEVAGWIQGQLPGRGRGLRVLEVGCGPGHLAARLLRDGVAVTAIDASEEQVAKARELGVAAIVSDFLAFEGEPFDALLFTRSLHHLWPLEAALGKIRALAAPGGLILADEFAHDRIDAPTAAWFWDLQAVLEEGGVLAPDVPRHPHHPDHRHGHRPRGEGPPPLDPVERWHQRHLHDPPLHRSGAMVEALRRAFVLRAAERCPYLHRYFSERVADGEQGTRLFLRVRALERLRVEQGLLVPIGLRLVAVARRPRLRRQATASSGGRVRRKAARKRRS